HGVFIDATAISTFPANATASLINGAGITGIVSTFTPPSTTASGSAQECPSSLIPDVSTSTSGAVNPANVILNTTTFPVINASSPGIGGVAIGGIPTSVSTPTAGNGLITPGVNLVQGSCNGSDAFHADCGVATIYTSRVVPKQIAT